MNALMAAKRLTLLTMALMLILTTTTALAKDDEHGYLGVMLQGISSSMAKALQLDDDEGVMINKVVEDGPADKAGLEDGDVILKFDGRDIEESSDLSKAVRKSSPGDEVVLEILRNGKRVKKTVEMGEAEASQYNFSFHSGSDAPDVEFFSEGGDENIIVMNGGKHSRSWTDDDGTHKVIVMSGGDHEGSWFGDDGNEIIVDLENFSFGEDRGFMGLELGDLNEQLGEYFGVDDGKGALINKVREDSPAANAGLKAGDVIISLNGEAIGDADEVHDVMSDTEPEQEIEIKVVRHGQDKVIKVTLGEMPENEFIVKMDRAPMAHMPRMIREYTHGAPHGMKHDIRVMTAPKRHELHEIIRIHEDREGLDEVREELDELKRELKELRKELQK